MDETCINHLEAEMGSLAMAQERMMMQMESFAAEYQIRPEHRLGKV